MSLNKEMVEVDRRKYKAYAAAKPANATPSRTYVNSAMTELYTGNKAQTARAGADDHTEITSRGF